MHQSENLCHCKRFGMESFGIIRCLDEIIEQLSEISYTLPASYPL